MTQSNQLGFKVDFIQWGSALMSVNEANQSAVGGPFVFTPVFKDFLIQKKKLNALYTFKSTKEIVIK